ncbi:MAG: D-glycero-beta-D-manno-heptose 1-phosphate adenylyltransferase [Ignavibacteriales bacterium]|nr:D-glycero-beta-D-manno-heptose 1-phosphate adenylyltransferase [Ignavibacteriales bacterium]
MGAVLMRNNLIEIRQQLRKTGKSVVFTNGCFDILHRGHVDYLSKARALGDILIVGVNTDASVKRLKGANRPIVQEDDRAAVLAALAVVDYVCLFDEETPYELIRALVPDILVKGADWSVGDIVGKDIVEAAGGAVHTIEFLPNRSTTNIIQKIVQTVAPRSG